VGLVGFIKASYMLLLLFHMEAFMYELMDFIVRSLDLVVGALPILFQGQMRLDP